LDPDDPDFDSDKEYGSDEESGEDEEVVYDDGKNDDVYVSDDSPSE
jgi:hypothetical protein